MAIDFIPDEIIVSRTKSIYLLNHSKKAEWRSYLIASLLFTGHCA